MDCDELDKICDDVMELIDGGTSAGLVIWKTAKNCAYTTAEISKRLGERRKRNATDPRYMHDKTRLTNTDWSTVLNILLTKYNLHEHYNTLTVDDQIKQAQILFNTELATDNALLCDMLDDPAALARCGYMIDDRPELTSAEKGLIASLPCEDIVGVRRINGGAKTPAGIGKDAG